jgi:hypothetical protein
MERNATEQRIYEETKRMTPLRLFVGVAFFAVAGALLLTLLARAVQVTPQSIEPPSSFGWSTSTSVTTTSVIHNLRVTCMPGYTCHLSQGLFYVDESPGVTVVDATICAFVKEPPTGPALEISNLEAVKRACKIAATKERE